MFFWHMLSNHLYGPILSLVGYFGAGFLLGAFGKGKFLRGTWMVVLVGTIVVMAIITVIHAIHGCWF